MDTVNAGGFRIGFERKGTGPPLVLLHGALSDSRAWRKQLDGLCDEFTVVAWDAPGCGRSSDPPESFRLSDYADCLAEFLQEIGIERPHLLGLSFGGGLALEFYHRYPGIPRTMLLVSAYAGWAGSLPAEEVRNRLEQALKLSEEPPEQLVKMWMPSMFSSSVPPEVVEEAAAMMADFHPIGMRAMARAFAEADLRDVLPHIEVPTLLLYGEYDQRSPSHVARELHARIPKSTLVIIPGVGHDISTEVPAIFNTEVRGFLSSIRD